MDQERLDRLSADLTTPYPNPEDEQRALKLAWEWIQTGVFGRREFETLMEMSVLRGRREVAADVQEMLDES